MHSQDVLCVCETFCQRKIIQNSILSLFYLGLNRDEICIVYYSDANVKFNEYHLWQCAVARSC